jgi:hypothetical protein
LLKKTIATLFFVGAAAGQASLAADRHVYLDTNGDGILNDCPNPAHNAKGTSNTDNLQYCNGGSSQGRVIGTATGRVAASVCTSGGGTVANLANNTLADVDGDGTAERVYGHPQTCVWYMAKSDSCEVHSGTYRKSGAVCDEDCACGEAMAGSCDSCDRYDCWYATVVALGDGPNMDGTGYGTAAAPGYLRGAVMNSSTDSWDTNGNKVPDTVTGEPKGYPAIFSGDRNGNAAFEQTACTATSGDDCSGDAFFGVVVGCGGGGGYGSSFCRPNAAPGSTYIKIDINANDQRTQNAGAFTYNTKEVHNLIVKDIEFSGYNGGNSHSGSSGARIREGLISLEGNDGSSDGLKVDHVYMHDNDYSLHPSQEHDWAYFGDDHNGGCADVTEIKNSFLVQNNEKLVDDDCGPNSECGCPKSVHDNRIVMDIRSPRGTTSRIQVFFYLKSVDTFQNGAKKKAHRIWNNEFIFKSAGTSNGAGYFMDLQEFGNSRSHGLGELWVYGNVFRSDPSYTNKIKRFWLGSCTENAAGTDSWKAFFFNNTFFTDFASNSDGIWEVCHSSGEAGERMVERNNVYMPVIGTSGLNPNRTGEDCNGSACSWAGFTHVFDHEYKAMSKAASCAGTFADCTTSPTFYNALNLLAPKVGGTLDRTGSCDPDADGVAGVDYNWDGVNDTSWRDLAGNLVTCPTLASPINIGAIQSSVFTTDPTPPGNVQGLTRTDKN